MLEDILDLIYEPSSILRTIIYNTLNFPKFQQYISYHADSNGFDFPISELFRINPNAKWFLIQGGFGLTPKPLVGHLFINLREEEDIIAFWIQ